MEMGYRRATPARADGDAFWHRVSADNCRRSLRHPALGPVSPSRRRHGNKEATMGTEAFKAARDFLFAHRTDYCAAHAGFRWPELENFNYALDWFDAELARGGNASRLALKIVGDGAATATFGELSERSSRVANGLRALGVKRGDRILLMLGNVVP